MSNNPKNQENSLPVPVTDREEIERALAELVEHRDSWANLEIVDRRAILRELRRDFAGVAERWVESSVGAKGIAADSPRCGEEWLGGPFVVMRNIRLLDEALADLEAGRSPHIPGPISTRPDGRVVAQVFPQTVYDRVLYGGISAEVWMERGVRKEQLSELQARAYQTRSADQESSGKIVLVLGAGNVSSIGPMDVLYKIFVEQQVVIFKAHPVNAYLGPLMEEAFRALIDWGALRVVYGGVEEGAFLCRHREVHEIHITGSDKTVEAIVFGVGDEGEQRKRERRPRLDKKITSELGNVSAVIVVPGPWSSSDISYHAEGLVGSLTNNAGFNCNATRVIVQRAEWQHRHALDGELERQFSRTDLRSAYYPGASGRYATLVEGRAATQFGQPRADQLAWTTIDDADTTDPDDLCFRMEAFCGLLARTTISAETDADFLDRAVEFANETTWGTLNVTLLVHPKSLADRELSRSFERALENLRFGTIAINAWAAMGYGLVVTPWGAHPGHDIYDIQSGDGWVHNTLMLERIEKAVVRAPFRIKPKPVWFPSHRSADQLGRRLTNFEQQPGFLKLPGLIRTALAG